MKALIITAAGLSSRFCRSLGKEELKSIYFDDDLGEQATILYRILSMASDFDSIIVVGGYRFEELAAYVQTAIPSDIQGRITLVHNDHYSDKGSCYSLCIGIDALPDSTSNVVFAEGDLCIDAKTFASVSASNRDVVTTTGLPVEANRSVALYFDASGKPRYAYDTEHGCLYIDEPFKCIYDSGQIWCFSNADRLKAIRAGLSEDQCASTNLELIGTYFRDLSREEIEIYQFVEWTNCNTVNDYRRVFRKDVN